MSSAVVHFDGERGPGHDRIRAFVLEALELGLEPVGDWPTAVRDVARELDRIEQSSPDPDARMRARLGLSVLAGIWLTPDLVDDLYLGKFGNEAAVRHVVTGGPPAT